MSTTGTVRVFARVFTRFFVLLALASVLIFLLLRAAPGNPARVALGVSASDEDVAELSAALGLNRPLVVQYLDWIADLLRGDFGTSLVSQENITSLVWDRAQVSLILVGLAMALSSSSAMRCPTPARNASLRRRISSLR